MDDISNILNIDLVFQKRFSSLAQRVVDGRTENKIYENIERLRRIDEDLYIASMQSIPHQTVEIVLERVAREARTNASGIGKWLNKDLRIISYYLSELHEDERAFLYGLKILGASNKNYVFNGLVLYLLNNWLSSDQDYKKAVRSLLLSKINSYNGKNRKYITLKNNISFLEDESGAIRMAALISMKQLDLEEAPTLLGFSKSFISLPYFSEVILKYIERTQLVEFGLLDRILHVHNLDRTRKLALAQLIFDADENGNELREQNVSRYARSILGDISLASSWSPFTGATETDVATLRRAKDLVVQWNNRNVIKVFFEKCVKDPVRKQFWLKRAPSVVDFRIVGVVNEKYKLEKDERTKDLVSNYFIPCLYKQDTALILCIKDKVFVEYSKVGSLYVHNHNAQCLKPIYNGNKHIAKTDSFKTNIYRKLIDQEYITTYSPEGRMPHMGDWEGRLNKWFRKMMDNREAPNIGFTKNNDDEIFVVKAKEPEVRYVDNIKYMLASKDIPTKKGCHFVVNKQGYYAYLPYGTRYAFIKPLDDGETPNGAVFVRNHEKGWFKVVHIYMKKESVSFYIKTEGRYLIYKLNDDDEKTIKLKL